MKALLKIIIALSLLFASTFLIASLTGALTIEKVRNWLELANQISSLYVAIAVILLLFCDLFIAVPTLTISILAGFFLGFPVGSISAITGMILAGCTGYAISRQYGNALIKFLIKDPGRRIDASKTFKKYGFAMIIMSRAVPIFPEVSACLAGLTRMKFTSFFTAWSLSSIPYALIAAYAGSVSSIENPMPAIYAALSLSAVLWIGWFLFSRYQKAEMVS